MWQATIIDILTAYYNEFINAELMGRVQVASRFLPWLLLAVFLISKLFKSDVKGLYPTLLCAEYTIWPVWFYYIQDELLGYIAYLVVYLSIISALLKYAQDSYVKYFASLYALSAVVVLSNMVAYISPNLPIFQTFYNIYFEMMSIIMIVMACLGMVAMYDSGNGGSRVRAGNSKRNNYRANKINLARMAKG